MSIIVNGYGVYLKDKHERIGEMLDESDTFDFDGASDNFDGASDIQESGDSFTWRDVPKSSIASNDQDADLVEDEIARSGMFTYSLLDREQEQALAAEFDDINRAMVTNLFSYPVSRHEFVQLLSRFLDTPTKKRMFATEQHYFALRRELDDLLSEEETRVRLSALLNHLVANSKKSEILAARAVDDLSRYSAHIDWPGPLVYGFAGRFIVGGTHSERLRESVTQFLKNCGSHAAVVEAEKDKVQSDCLRHLCQRYLRVRDTFVKHNMRLVYHVAKRYAYRSEDLPELIQEGSFGLLRAAEKYRCATGYRFSTYAHHWIDSKIRKARVNLDKLVYVAPDIDREQTQLRNKVERERSEGRTSSTYQVAMSMGFSEERMRTLTQLNQHYYSFDQSANDEDGPNLHAKYPDTKARLVDAVSDAQISEELDFLMQFLLSDIERYVLNERFGRLDSVAKTRQEIGEIIGLSRERARQIEVNALEKLREHLENSPDGNELALYLDPVDIQ